MKKNLNVLLLLLSVFAFSFAHEAQAQADQSNYFVLTRNIGQLKAIILAADALAAEEGDQFGDYQVVICGQAVEDMVKTETMTPILTMAEKSGVKILACGFSLQKFKVDAEKLPSAVGIVENGILHGFQLQKKGYYQITL
ncbi:DsrE family protein [Algoriphagus sp. CAU 1675]|uniref:DsrE family protein n=1 Tax=Algoriphagus sp. CAU 1675 TaxID=3032597 RepID=UPI0023DA9BF3|nr:DsrE family protein [Algoriphagus sp. CAU 1675]MDF2158030.1 DsrE family protein [Algoriphagus sp. CAU 1675]